MKKQKRLNEKKYNNIKRKSSRLLHSLLQVIFFKYTKCNKMEEFLVVKIHEMEEIIIFFIKN